jgi:hypothetical protein
VLSRGTAFQLKPWVSPLTLSWVVLHWPVPGLALLSAHHLSSRYGTLTHSESSVSLGVKEALANWFPDTTVGCPLAHVWALRSCFVYSLAGPWTWAFGVSQCSLSFCWHGVYSVAHCLLTPAVFLEACVYFLPSLFPEALLSQSSNCSSWPRTHLVIRIIFRTQKRKAPPLLVYVTLLLCPSRPQYKLHLGACQKHNLADSTPRSPESTGLLVELFQALQLILMTWSLRTVASLLWDIRKCVETWGRWAPESERGSGITCLGVFCSLEIIGTQDFALSEKFSLGSRS